MTETGAETTHVIDTDVHEMVTATTDLLPFLAPKWHHYITDYGWTEFNATNVGFPYTNPTPGRGARLDAYVDGKGTPGSSLALMQAQLLDLYHIDIAILNGFFHPQSMQVWYDFATEAAAAYNDWQIQTWLEREPRLRGSVHFSTHDPLTAAREIDRVGSHPQMVQAFLPVVNDRQWGERRYFPIYEACVRNGLVLAMHHNGQTRTAVGFPHFYMEHHATLPQAHMSQVASLICNGVFDQFPVLKLVVLEGGFTWLPHLMFRMDQHYRQFRSEVPWMKRRPSDYMRDNVRLATQPIETMDTHHFMNLIDMMGSDRVLIYSSDYPHYDFDAPDRAFPSGIPDELKQRILWKNAAETYGFELT